MAMHVKDSAVWKEVKSFFVRNSGVWTEVQKAFVRDGGVWKQFFENGVQVSINANTADFDLESWLLLNTDWNGTDPIVVNLTVGDGIVVYASSPSTYAMTIDLPAGSLVKLTNYGSIIGCGGAGGAGGGHAVNGSNGSAGGPALFTANDMTLNNQGTIGGGGGGGGGGGSIRAYKQFTIFDGENNQTINIWATAAAGGGGGGAGWPTSLGAVKGLYTSGGNGSQINYTTAVDGLNGGSGSAGSGGPGGQVGRFYDASNQVMSYGGTGGSGGALGQPGSTGGAGSQSGSSAPTTYLPGSGGAAGVAIQGYSNITISTLGTIAGPTQG
ncbi:MAG: hypothetical protein LPL29_14590 [Alphaproteobacteria bacterium]|nr:hypothetical protein [Alphaproteobacteria bacterium]